MAHNPNMAIEGLGQPMRLLRPSNVWSPDHDNVMFWVVLCIDVLGCEGRWVVRRWFQRVIFRKWWVIGKYQSDMRIIRSWHPHTLPNQSSPNSIIKIASFLHLIPVMGLVQGKTSEILLPLTHHSHEMIYLQNHRWLALEPIMTSRWHSLVGFSIVLQLVVHLTGHQGERCSSWNYRWLIDTHCRCRGRCTRQGRPPLNLLGLYAACR